MRNLTVCVFSALSFATLALAGSLPRTEVRGEYVEARTADVYTGACFANSEVGLTGNLAVFGWKVEKGSWKGVTLDGLGVVGVVKARSTLGDIHSEVYPVKSVLIVDEKANLEQRVALKELAQRLGGDLLQDIVRIDYRPVTLEFADNNVHSMQAKLTAGELAKIETRPVNLTDHICMHEEAFYPPLTKLDHAMPAVAEEHSYKGDALQHTWSSPNKRSAFVGNFHYQE